MALEAIKEIIEAEEKAKDIIKNAQNLKNQIIKEGEAKALSEYRRILDESKQEASTLINSAVSEAEKKAKPILEAGEKEKENIINIPKEKFDKAVNLVVERIVNINGNS